MNINELLPTGFIPLVGRSIRLGFSTYTTFLNEMPGFTRNSGKSLTSSLLHAFTEEALYQQLKTTSGCKCKTDQNKSGSYSYLHITIPGKCHITSSRVSHQNKIPRPALFREYLSSSNNPVLFSELYPELDNCLPYLIITHGIDKKSNQIFASIGMPDGVNTKEWLSFISLNEHLQQTTFTREEIAEVQSNAIPRIKRLSSNV